MFGRFLFCTFMCVLFAWNSVCAQEKNTGDDSFTGIGRWAFRTNALDWMLLVPNVGGGI